MEDDLVLSYTLVKPSQIQEELNKIEEINKQNNLLRASLFTLIVFAEKNEKLSYFVQLVDHIIEQFPCRVIFIEEDTQNSSQPLQAAIGAKMVHNGGYPSVVCDIIYLTSPKNNTEQILHLIYQHTLIDLPVHLLWGKDPTISHPLFFQLRNMSQRLIFHSECSLNLQTLAEKILNNILKYHWEVADLNWVYLQEWREILKAIFNTPEALEDLRETTDITLQFCGSANHFFCHNHFQVHYLHAWLAAELGWKFSSYQEKEGKKIITYQGEHQPITVTAFETKCPLDSDGGAIVDLQIKTKTKKIFNFASEPQNEFIQVEIKDEEKANNAYNTRLMKAKWQVYLAKEICYKETSLHYEETLKVLSTIHGLV